MRGCRTVLSARHQLLVRKFSAPTASVNLDWHELFEGLFGKSLPTRSNEKQPIGSATFLTDIFKKAVHNKAAKNKSSQQRLSIEDLQLFDDVGLPPVFQHLIKDLSVDHAVLLCTKLPANYLNAGINTLISLLLERVQQNDADVTDQGVLTDRIFKLVELSKGRNCSLSEETRQRLLKWLPNSGNTLMCHNILQDLPQAKDREKITNDLSIAFDLVDRNYVLDAECRKIRGLPNTFDKVDSTDFTTKTRLLGVFYALGKSASTGKGKDTFIVLEKLQLKGMPEDDLREMIDSFTKGFMEIHPNSRDIRRGVEVFKRITQSLKLNTVASYNMLISHCANHGEIDLCIDLIQTMKVRGLEPCASSYEPLIMFFAKTLEIFKAEDILHVMKLSGMQPSVKSYESLIGAHAKADNFVRAFNLIEDIPCEDLTAQAYTPIIHAYGMKGQVLQALSVLQKMKRKNVKPVGANFSSLIHACALRKNSKGAEKVFDLYSKEYQCSEADKQKVMAAMLRVYAGCGDSEQLKKMMASTDINVLATRKAKSSILKGFSETGRNEEALRVYNEIRNEGGYPEPMEFRTLLQSLGNAGELDQLLALFEPFRKLVQGRSRVIQEEMMSVACSHIVHALISHNHLEGALIFLQKVQLEDAGDVETLCSKVFIEGEIAVPNRVHLSLKDKLQFLEAMREKLRIQPTRLAYESLLQSCAKEKDAYHAEAVLLMMRSDRLQLNMFTYMIILRIIVSTGDKEKVTVLLSEMNQTMQVNGLADKHVKMIIKKILKSGNFDY
ncbi:hypothetical protein GOP47_0006123 [Adiantum capillus-veneris]|uniref:Leucine-rich PPR motif-containing protein, mitochondrial n=1 Tax=Adiantum capillus-veneris TaxID=13818 RepID=A0A9D4V351_ADICA|nr:hypothetical protein GOP47_0006123 [Adiantum capillus-veneris]